MRYHHSTSVHPCIDALCKSDVVPSQERCAIVWEEVSTAEPQEQGFEPPQTLQGLRWQGKGWLLVLAQGEGRLLVQA